MLAVAQRVTEASVSVDGEVVGEIGRGLLVLVGVARDDSDVESEALARKLVNLRLFPDGKQFERSVIEVGGGILVVSQFTLLAETAKGRRPSFDLAASGSEAERLYERFVSALEGFGARVRTGAFGQSMAVSLVNDGPVTILLNSRKLGGARKASG